MEAITIAGLAVVAIGGYYSVIDFLNDVGIHGRRSETAVKKLPVARGYILARQPGIKKMAGMHI